MSQWEDKLEQHAIHTTLANLNEALESEVLISEDINVIAFTDKIGQLSAYIDISLKNVIPPLINQGHLNNANSHLQNVLNELNAYISNRNTAHLHNTATHIDSVMSQINALPVQRKSVEEDGFTESLIRFKKLVEKSFKEIKSLKDELADSVSDISSDTEMQKNKIEELSVSIDNYQQNIVEHLENFDARFTSFETAFNAKLDESLEKSKEELEAFIQEREKVHKNKIEELSNNANELLKHIEEKKKAASDLVQVIGNIGITGNYQKIANQEKEAADRWRNIALLLMISMVVIIAVTIGISASNGFDWKLALFRIGAALILAIPATYAAKESSKHRALETHNRRAELELASLDPFLEKLPDEIAYKIKEGLTDKFFGLTTNDQSRNENVSYSALFDLLKEAVAKK